MHVMWLYQLQLESIDCVATLQNYSCFAGTWMVEFGGNDGTTSHGLLRPQVIIVHGVDDRVVYIDMYISGRF